jgi:hypothetical protein
VTDAAERESLIKQYAEGPERLRSAFQKVPEEARQWRPGPGKWSAHEIACHCADSETNAYVRIRTLMADKDPVIAGYDQDDWAIRFDYHTHPVAAALSAVEAVRANTVPLLRRLTDASWSKVGRHSQSGTYSAEGWLRSYAEHLEKHSRQIERNVELWKAQTAGGR